jgi:hypothetical protein
LIGFCAAVAAVPAGTASTALVVAETGLVAKLARSPLGTRAAKLVGRPGIFGRPSCDVGAVPATFVTGAVVAAAPGRLIEAVAAGGGVAGCDKLGKLSEAVAPGAAGAAAGVAGTPLRADSAVCSKPVTTGAGAEASCWIMSRPGTPGVVGVAGSADAVALSASAAEHSPAAAIALVSVRFLIRDIVLPSR